MASLTQGDPLPDITQTTTKATEAPSYYTDYLSGLSQAGQTALARPADQLIAGYDPLQTTGYGQFESAAGAYKPGLAQAQQYLGEGAGVSEQDINRFMNPYTKNVVDEMGRLAQQNLQRNVMPSLKASAVGLGDLGSRRYATALGQSAEDIQRGLTGQQYGALSAGYKQALDTALAEAGLQQKAAGLEGDLAKMEQVLGLSGAEALTKAGAERQALEQAKIDAPLKQAANVAALMRGYQVPLDTTEVFKGPKAGSYATSPLSNVMGIASILAASGKDSALTNLVNKYFGGGGNTDQTTTTGDGTVTPNQDYNMENWWNSLSQNERDYLTSIDESGI
jgi:hypothetical protein